MQFLDIKKNQTISLYHGSPITNLRNFIIEGNSRGLVDFGKGIYFTELESQAMDWSVRNRNSQGAVYQILINPSKLNIKCFTTYSDEFIDTFCKCRLGFEEYTTVNNYDAIYGYMIDHDRAEIAKYTRLYIAGKISASAVRSNLKVFRNKTQFCIKNQDILNTLKINKKMLTYRDNFNNIRYSTIIRGDRL